MTDVTRNETPVEVPTSPLARSRTSAGMSRVTHVGSAMPKRLPAMTPSITMTMNTQSIRLPGSRNVSLGRQQVEHQAGGVDDQRHRRRGLHDPLLVVVVDEAAEPDPRRGDGDEEDPGDHAGGEHRPGLEVDPERHGEPHREVHDRHGQRVEQQVQERPLRRLAEVEPRSLGGHDVVLLGGPSTVDQPTDDNSSVFRRNQRPGARGRRVDAASSRARWSSGRLRVSGV